MFKGKDVFNDAYHNMMAEAEGEIYTIEYIGVDGKPVKTNITVKPGSTPKMAKPATGASTVTVQTTTPAK